jgi:methylornithine synthase
LTRRLRNDVNDAPTQPARDVVRALCAAALDGALLTEAELEILLAIEDEDLAGEVCAAARAARAAHFGDGVFLYGFVYFSTYCRNECAFCYYRADNALSPRYRKTADEVVAICEGLASSGVDMLDLTMGEDPVVHGEPGYRALLDLVRAVREATGLPVMVSPGVLPAEALHDLRAAGAEWYALYQETHNAELYARLRLGQAFGARVAARRAARDAGLLVEDGMLTGIGDGAGDRARSVAAMRDASWEQVRVMTFVPQEGTPLAGLPPQSDLAELLTIAVLRLTLPDRLIPASLDVDGIRGLERRLAAGANVVTSIVPPTSGLAGVSNAVLDIDEGHRTVAGVLPHLARLGLRPAGTEAYRDALERLRVGAAAPHDGGRAPTGTQA